MKRILIILLLALLTIQINCSGGGGSKGSATTSLVTITVGNSSNGQAMSLIHKKSEPSSAALAAIPSNVYKLVFTIAAPDMPTITKEVLVAGQTSITETFDVPNGNNRYFLVEAKDASGNVLYRGSATVNLNGNPIILTIFMAALDTTPPTVISNSPATDATDVPITSVIIVTFSESMDCSTFSSSTFTLMNNGTTVAGTTSCNGAVITFTPSSSLAYGTTYTATITTGVKDLLGNAMASDYAWSFTTGTGPDTTPPTVIAVSPANGATGVAITTTVTATFSEAMDSSTINTTTFTLSNGGSPVSGTVTYSGATATFTPSASLLNGTTYTATITTGAKDLAGNAMAADYSWIFTTVTIPDTIPPSVPTGLTATPVNSTRIYLSWTASTDNVGVAGYKIYRGGTYLNSAAAPAYNDTGLSPTTLYCYTVSAYDAAGNESAQSTQACATTYAPGYTVSGNIYEYTPTDSLLPGVKSNNTKANIKPGVGRSNIKADILLPGVRVTLSGTSFSFNTNTDSEGYYEFTDVQNGDYTIVPNKRGFWFDPVNYPITVSGADVPYMDFEAFPDVDLEVINVSAKTTYPYSISFQVRNNGTGDANNVEVYVHSSDGESNRYNYETISVRGGRTESVTVYPTVPPYYWEIWVDYYNDYIEQNECNNCTNQDGFPWCCFGG